VRSSNDVIGLRAVQESRVAMEKLIVKMDNLESGFDRIAERSRGLLYLCIDLVSS
jgi:autophagy-related protein 11